MQRRKFISSAAAMAAASLVGDHVYARVNPVGRASKPLSILILGGTRFIGVHMTTLALARGHKITFFNRGRTRIDMFPSVERIKGDRNDAIDGLKDRKFDAVVDNSGYVPRHVKTVAELIKPNVARYLFISSISVYPDFSVPRGEDSPVGKLADEANEKVDGESYGPLKALCEQAALKVYGDKTTVLRPGLIVGPDDNTDRFTYWPARAARGGAIAAPGAPTNKIQVIDVRDLAALTLQCIEQDTGGTFNVVSEPGRFSIGQLLDHSVRSAAALVKPRPRSTVSWIPADFLEQQKVLAWSDMPAWFPPQGTEAAGAATPVTRALAAGLVVRPLADTVRDTLAWHLKRPAGEREKLRAGLDAPREAALLKAWRDRPK